MYHCCKEMYIDAAHKLNLSYDSPCENLHGHSWRVRIYCKSETLDENGMVYDFKKLKDATHGKLDHKFINEVVDFNPTAENLAKWMADQVGETCYKVEVWESVNNLAWWERD